MAPRDGRSIRSRRAGSGSAALSLDRLTTATLADAVNELTARDTDLAAIVERYGVPPLWDRQPGFATLVHLILEQQVSLASAQAAFDRLLAAAVPLTPATFLALTDAELLAIGFSRQKARYGRALAAAVTSGALDLDGFDALDDDDVRVALETVPGIGPWTSSIYLLMVLGRPDVWPVGDVALAISIRVVKVLEGTPGLAAMLEIGEAWRPWRSVAARLLWLDYLGRRDRLG